MKMTHNIRTDAWIGADEKPSTMELNYGEIPVARIEYQNLILWFNAQSARRLIETLQSVKWSGE